MVMYARKQPRLGDGCDRRDSQPYQTLKYSSKSHPGGDHRHEKMRDHSDVTPPCKVLRRSDSPENKHGDSTGHSRAKAVHAHRARDRDGGTSYSPHENSHNHSTLQSSNSHSTPSKTSDTTHEPGDDWSEHISSSGKKYYYNCRTEVSQWEKPKEWLEREQRQKEATKQTALVNSFPKDRDYRREAMQTSVPPAFSATKSAQAEKSTTTHVTQSSSSGSGSLNPSSGTPGTSSSSTVPVSPVLQSPAPPLLQDPTLLRQLLPALQTALQLNNASVDMAKINEVLTAAVTQASLQSMLHKILTAGPSAFNITTILSQAAQLSSQAQQSNQSPMSLTSDASSPRSYVSPRISTPQTNAGPLKPLLSTQPVISLSKVSTPTVKQSSHSQQISQQPLPGDKQHTHDATTASPRNLQRQGSQRSPSPGGNHVAPGSSSNAPSSASATPTSTTRPSCSFTPTLAAHFNENLIKHVQGWPAEHAEKQASRLREEAHTMGSICMSENCTELKNLRSLVRVSEIQATLREQRILFLRQQIKELEKLKNQNSFMV
ncbi:WW domain-containing adapter protein with coiled-coil isoform X2 [Corythoichthys intestinalis]|uniref:WW domain-containing adapter protein with coiled-coil isoform X2 n=1 Tax=Corythoichthys intestinalis TaxID=161448 RepID=UPI0025A4DFE5|nr:WW domain-containing adapter protein with coiled-coil isoform X2 [Corythoichthys intestinalis]XP_061811664.1 WW domain-containing adapter protein with coiled-coil-like [Nerophis lumbriciformis]